MPLKIITNLKGIITPLQSRNFGNLEIQENVAILIKDDTILDFAQEAKLIDENPHAERMDGSKCWAFPGFVDPHTHPVFYKTREDEFEMRILGKSYEEIAAEGGGIRNSARVFRKASIEELTELTVERIGKFIEYGTTTIEAKSGYGLSLEDEIKSLRVLKTVAEMLPITIVPTFLGAHEVPDEYRDNRQDYINLITEEMIPAVAEEKLAEFCDIFTEKGVFSIEESRHILEVAIQHGLTPKLHADELHSLGGAELAAEVQAISADHLLMVTDTGISAMKNAGVVPVLLPGTAFFLGKTKYAPARRMIEAGLNVALATDYNPGSSYTQNMPLILSIACTQMKMTPGETIHAATLMSARAINREKLVGSLEKGKKADIILLDIPNYRYLPYHYGMNPVKKVIRHGELIWQIP